jgi:uncharacterized cupredoxin-like copper-binding protein
MSLFELNAAMRRFSALVSVVLVAAALTVAFPASTALAKAKGGRSVAAKLYEFGIKRSPKFVAAGKVTFKAKNIGTIKHEFVVVKVATPDAELPTTADGSVDEEAIPEADQIGEVEDVKPKKSGKLTTKLDAGSYVLFCNIVSKADGTTFVHYAKGMHTTFTVG